MFEVHVPHVYIWHPSVHEIRADNRLCFWRLSFGPEYDEEAIRGQLAAIYIDSGARSHITYEMLGEFDQLLRVWLPRAVNPEEVDALIDRRLRPLGLWEHQYMAVRGITDHWAWTPAERPDAESLRKLRQWVVDEVGDFNDAAFRCRGNRDSFELLVEPDVQELLDEHLLRRVDLTSNQIQFFVHFDHPRRPFRNEIEIKVVADAIRGSCGRTLDAVRDANGDSARLSLYIGTGTMSSFFIIGKVPSAIFYPFVRSLIFGLRDSSALQSSQIRPYTHVSADPTFIAFSERPQINPAGVPIDRVLFEEESRSLEFKASFSVNVDRLLSDGKEGGRDKRREDDVLKAVCGLLNVDTVGRLVIGVLEPHRYVKRVDALGAVGALVLYRSPMGEFEIGAERFSTRPVAVDHPPALILLGTDFEARHGGAKNFDEFSRRLEELLRERISPNPLSHLSVESEVIAGHRVVAITVRPSTQEWFVARPQAEQGEHFYVREIASTRAYQPHDAESYKRANPRSVL